MFKIYQECDTQWQQQQMLKMPPPPPSWRWDFTLFTEFFLKLLKAFLVFATSNPFSVMFQALQAYCFITVDPFLKKYPQKEVRCCEVKSGDRGGQSPRPTKRSPKKSWNKGAVVFAVYSIALSCWNQQFRLLCSSRVMNGVKRFG